MCSSMPSMRGAGNSMQESYVNTARFQSEAFAGRAGMEEFREAFGRGLLKLDIEPLPGHPLDFDLTVRAIAGFGLTVGHLSPTRNVHTQAMIENDDLVLLCAPQGSGTLSQIGREVTIADGEATLVSNASTGTYVGHKSSQLRDLRFNRAMLSALAVDVDAAVARRISRHDPILQLMLRYAEVINDDAAIATAALRQVLVQHMHDLAALLVGARRDAAEVTTMRGLRAARLVAIRRELDRNISDPDFSLPALARRLAITPRYVQRLLAEEGTSFRDELAKGRLKRARSMIGSAANAHRSIIEIAMDCGFSSLPHFHRTFRRAFDETPGDVRARALRSASK